MVTWKGSRVSLMYTFLASKFTYILQDVIIVPDHRLLVILHFFLSSKSNPRKSSLRNPHRPTSVTVPITILTLVIGSRVYQFYVSLYWIFLLWCFCLNGHSSTLDLFGYHHPVTSLSFHFLSFPFLLKSFARCFLVLCLYGVSLSFSFFIFIYFSSFTLQCLFLFFQGLFLVSTF